ncbi:hypothetical protein CDAR_69271 [Caerostris darwini]|uniref:Uncharacterized protein n=1 Tax=Caerostris darwini TaxID=1538125 RepID=A0AAV4U0K8_9ARAC|nr:hypothetical protein CDAR_69271 [Caerostris darwini]
MSFMYSKSWHCVRGKSMDYSNAWHVVTEAKTLAMAWHKKTPPFGSRGYLFRMQTLKEFVLPVYLFYLSSRVAVELLFKKKKKRLVGGHYYGFCSHFF